MIPAIPDNVLEHIFTFLEPSNPLTAEDKATGCACCLVSKRFYPLAQRLIYKFAPSDPNLDWCDKCRLGFPPEPEVDCLNEKGEIVCPACFAPGRKFARRDGDGHYWGVFEKWTSDTIRDVLDQVKADSTVRGVSKLCREFGARDPARQPLPWEIMLMLRNRIEGVKPKETLNRETHAKLPSLLARLMEVLTVGLANDTAEEMAEEGAAEEADEEED